jgi:hypothetical protein
MLSNEDKLAIINSHKKNIEFNKYNIQISIIEESAIDNPSQETLASLNSQIEDYNDKLAALDAEIASL